MQLTQQKIELIKKIINARLTKEELSLVKGKALELISRRPSKTK